MSILKEIKRLFGVKGASIEEALKNVDSIGGGSGSGGVFITTVSFDETTLTGSLDKTWQEIYDAISSGMIGVIRSAMTAPGAPAAYGDMLIASIFYSEGAGAYVVKAYENGTQRTLTTATADGYPSTSADPGPQ